MSDDVVFLQFHIRCVPHRWRVRSSLAARAQVDCAAPAPDGGRAHDWILRDIGVIRERDMGTGLEVDPREAARQFWRS